MLRKSTNTINCICLVFGLLPAACVFFLSDDSDPFFWGGSLEPTVETTYLVSDFETESSIIAEQTGALFVLLDTEDEEATIEPKPDHDGGSIADGITNSNCSEFGDTYCLYVSGTKSQNGDNGIGAYFEMFATGEKVPRAFGSENQEGIVFWAKGNTSLRVGLATQETLSMEEGGLCDPENEKCNDFYKLDVFIDNQWREYVIGFTNFRQRGFGTSRVFDPNDIVEIRVIAVTQNPDDDFEFWIDNIGFYGGDAWDFMSQ